MQVDIQATFQDTRVLVARPVAVDISDIIRKLLQPFNLTEINGAQVKAFLDHFNALPEDERQKAFNPTLGSAVNNTLQVYQKVQLPPMDQILGLAMQAQGLPWGDIIKLFTETASAGSIDLRAFTMADSMEGDLSVGVCPIPLYEFSEPDFDLFLSNREVEGARERLKGLGIYQYFYPPADHVALGLVDQGVTSEADVLQATQKAPSLGHPFGDMEIITSQSGLVAVLEQMKDIGYVAEGEHGIEMSEQGRTIRSTVKFRPREGFLTKLVNRLNLTASISPKDFVR